MVRYYWEALRLGKRWHDVRHTFGTRLYGISKDIHLVQRANVVILQRKQSGAVERTRTSTGRPASTSS